MRPSLATDRISLGFWLNISFVVNYQGAFQSIVAIAIDLLTWEDRYFLWITAVPLPRRCLQSWQHSVSRMRSVTLALSGPPNLRPVSDHRYLILLLFRQLIMPQNCIYLQSDLSSLYKLNCNTFNHHERLCFSLHRPTPAIRHFFWLVVLAQWWWQAAEPASWLRNDLSIPRAPENMSHKNIITIYFHIWT